MAEAEGSTVLAPDSAPFADTLGCGPNGADGVDCVPGLDLPAEEESPALPLLTAPPVWVAAWAPEIAVWAPPLTCAGCVAPKAYRNSA